MFNQFLAAYREAIAFTEPDLTGDFAPETLTRIEADCQRFWDENYNAIRGNPVQAGHDFWLTRNRHGAGFWDGDWPNPAATNLTDASHAFGECEMYTGDDGRIYIFGG